MSAIGVMLRARAGRYVLGGPLFVRPIWKEPWVLKHERSGTAWNSERQLSFVRPKASRRRRSAGSPPNAGNSIAWLLWHIPEVEDNWVRNKLLNLPKRYPFGTSVKAHSGGEWPSKNALLSYFREVRALTKDRLEQTREEEFDRVIADEHFGSITVRQAWGGVVTSCAWHGGQIIFIANRLLGKAGASRAHKKE